MRKPHAKSKLKTPENPERMSEIYLYMAGNPDAEPPTPKHTYAETEAWLAAQDVDTNPQSLSEFFHWYPVWLKMQRASNVAETVKEVLAELPQLKLQADQVAKTMQAVFEAEALADRDTELGVALMRLRQNDRMLDLKEESGRTKAQLKLRDLELAERRVKLLEDNAAKAKAALEEIKTTGGMTPETLKKIEEAAKLL